MNLTVTKKEEVQRLRAQIEELSLQYIHNLNDDNSCILFSEAELVGLPPDYLKVLLLFILFPWYFAFHSLNFNSHLISPNQWRILYSLQTVIWNNISFSFNSQSKISIAFNYGVICLKCQNRNYLISFSGWLKMGVTWTRCMAENGIKWTFQLYILMVASLEKRHWLTMFRVLKDTPSQTNPQFIRENFNLG